ncbi:MAG: hypothetical protein ACYDH3_11820 [Candidatus Aminicenantales bacterium]
MNGRLKEEVYGSVARLLHWLEKNGWKGYDPYDIKEAPIIRNVLYAKNPAVSRTFSRALSLILRLFPLSARKILGIEKRLNAKGMGLFASSFINLYRMSGKAEDKARAEELLTWLSNHRSPGYPFPCWGYPFDWQSEILIPKGTPSAVVSSVVGDAFWKAYRVFGDPKYLNVCTGICRFFLNSLNVAMIDPDTVCFSYTPVDRFRVHNANLFVAEFLMRIGKETGTAVFGEMGRKAANFALSEQNEDGSLLYWGRAGAASHAGRIDHYHSGFELRLLHRIARLTGESSFRDAARRYAGFYRNRLLEPAGSGYIPKMRPRRVYPVDIHSCAEALLVQAEAGVLFPDSERLLDGLLLWILPRMRLKKGSFAFSLQKIGPLIWKQRIPFIRWGQAWMLYALSEVLSISAADSGTGIRDFL